MTTNSPEVQDKKSEFRGLVNNVLTFFILAVMTWVGCNITIMKNSLGELSTNNAVVSLEIEHLKNHDAIQDTTLQAHTTLLTDLIKNLHEMK